MFKLEFEVRDNELDIQGIVNNANYFVYMAHARHKFLHEIGINFAEMAEAKQYLMLAKAVIEFKRSLKANDIFYVTCKVVPDGDDAFACEQEIRLVSNNKLMATGYFPAVCIDGNTKKRYIPEKIRAGFQLD